MGKLMDILKKMSGREEDEDYTPRELIDRRLDSLRRQRQHQLNEVERGELKKQIREYQKDFQRKHLWGIKDNLNEEKKKRLLEAIRKNKKVNVLATKKKLLEKSSLLDNRKNEFKKKKVNILDNHGSFLR